MSDKTFTIITVCRNAEKEICRTMTSVLMQQGVDIEYIIKDGNSDDTTNLKIKEMIKFNKNEQIDIKHVIRSDNGIYGAMNQGIEMATGEWIIFMNAGDCFYDSNVLRDMAIHMKNGNSDIYYGDTLYRLNERYSFVQIHGISQMDNYFSLGHQSIFVKNEVLRKFCFDESYKIIGDYEFCVRAIKNQIIFKHINMIISICDREGISAQKKGLMYEEDCRMKGENCSQYRLKYYARYCVWEIKSVIAKLFPKWEQYRFCKNSMRRFNNIIKFNDRDDRSW